MTIWRNGKNLQIVWICINHQTGGACDMKSVKEKGLERAFVRVMNRIIANKEAYLVEQQFQGNIQKSFLTGNEGNYCLAGSFFDSLIEVSIRENS
jgi:hypothetical protein